jgi:hypothetical protein
MSCSGRPDALPGSTKLPQRNFFGPSAARVRFATMMNEMNLRESCRAANPISSAESGQGDALRAAGHYPTVSLDTRFGCFGQWPRRRGPRTRRCSTATIPVLGRVTGNAASCGRRGRFRKCVGCGSPLAGRLLTRERTGIEWNRAPPVDGHKQMESLGIIPICRTGPVPASGRLARKHEPSGVRAGKSRDEGREILPPSCLRIGDRRATEGNGADQARMPKSKASDRQIVAKFPDLGRTSLGNGADQARMPRVIR